MHAAMRWLIQNDPRVKRDPAWGTPINEEHGDHSTLPA
jgi:hypothetical protein